MKVKVVIVQSCPTLCDPMNWSPAASLSTGSSRQEYWSGLPCPLQGIFPTQGSNLCLLHVLRYQVDSLTLCHLGSPYSHKELLILVHFLKTANGFHLLKFFR